MRRKKLGEKICVGRVDENEEKKIRRKNTEKKIWVGRAEENKEEKEFAGHSHRRD